MISGILTIILCIEIIQVIYPEFYISNKYTLAGLSDLDKKYNSYIETLKVIDKTKDYEQWQYYKNEINKIEATRKSFKKFLMLGLIIALVILELLRTYHL